MRHLSRLPWCSRLLKLQSFLTIRSKSINCSNGVGVMLDVQGVLTRGSFAIPGAHEALVKLQNRNVPFVFLTNASAQTEGSQADSLTKLLDVQVSADQVILAHSPLKGLHHLHDKHVLAIGDGVSKDIMNMCGFSSFCTLNDIIALDNSLTGSGEGTKITTWLDERYLPIEGIILMGQPRKWEDNLQVLLDVLLTNGLPHEKYTSTHRHLPVVACKTDFRVTRNTSNPRLGHGAFLLALESLYEKMTGHPLVYEMILGKPSLSSFKYAGHVLNKMAAQNGLKTMYMIGDSVDVDICGSNLYNECLQEDGSDGREMKSVLVKTGVFSGDSVPEDDRSLHHRDVNINRKLRQPAFIADTVLVAVNKILQQEEDRIQS